MKEADDSILVSVIMPAYNAEKYIAQAIESVLCQEVPLELIVIDDCSMDKTIEIVEKYSAVPEVILVKNKENQGAAESRNIGIRMAKGKYIAFLDSDDWWEKGKLKEQCEVLRKINVPFCCTARELMNEDGISMGKVIGVPERITYKMLLKTNSIPCSSVLIRSQVAKEYGLCYNELHEDYILWLRILQKEPYAVGIDKPFLKSRMSQNGKSRNKFKSAKMQWGVYRHMGFGLGKSIYYFVNYTVNGIKKYR